MCRYEVTENTNPLFIIYNLVFNASKFQVITADYLTDELKRFNKNVPRHQIEEMLSQWYREGRLNVCRNGYVLA